MVFYTKQSFILSLLFLTFFVSQLKAQKLGAETNSNSSYAITSGGSLYTFGFNSSGQLGIGSTTQQSTPQLVSFPNGVTSWTAIAAGIDHSLAIGNDGNLYSWGYNVWGQLGIGSTTNQSTPQKVTFPSGVTSWTAIAGGGYYSLAIGNDGNLYSWGSNGWGQLGIGSTPTQSDTPYVVTKPSGVTSWTAIAAGDSHSLAIGNDGNFYSWGQNIYGQLGIGNTTEQNSPTALNSPLPVELTTFTAASTGSGSTSSPAVELKWNTATEVNDYGFEIQRSVVGDQKLESGSQSSINNLQWTKIGFVKGSGNSNSPKNYSFVDDNPLSGTIDYRLKQIDNDGNFKYSQIVTIISLPIKFELAQNYPNPFNPTTAINYQLSASSHVTLKVYDELGKEVTTLVNENKQAGNYKVTFNGSNRASGIYFYRITAGSFNAIRKLILLK